MRLERRLHALEERAGVGAAVVHVVFRDTPDVTKDEALEAYVSRTGKRPEPDDTVVWVCCVGTHEDIARYDAEERA